MLHDFRHLVLDVEEVFCEIIIVDLRQLLGPSSDTRWQCKHSAITSEPPQVMEDVEGLLHAVSRLLDAGELRYVFEHVFAISKTFRRFVGETASL